MLGQPTHLYKSGSRESKADTNEEARAGHAVWSGPGAGLWLQSWPDSQPCLHDQGRQGNVQVTKPPSWDNCKGRLAQIVTQGPSKGSSTCELQTEPRKVRVLSYTSALPATSVLGHSRKAMAPRGSAMTSPTNLSSGYSVATKKPALAQDAIYKAEKRDFS